MTGSICGMSESLTLALLLGTGVSAGFVDSIAGGGGLITLPMLLSVGMDPKLALGTNKLQATFGSGSATLHYAKAGAVRFKDFRRACLLAFLGSTLGSLLVQQLNAGVLKRFIPVVLVLVALYIWLRPRLGESDGVPRMSRPVFDSLFGLGLGFYDGFIGPGTGTFFTMAFMVWLGFNFTRSTAATKLLNFSTNLASLGVFLLFGKIWLLAGLVMGAGQWCGAWLGSHLVMRHGTRFIRPIFLGVVLLITLRMVYLAWIKP